MSDKKLGFFKEIPGALRSRMAVDQEWKKAQDTLYFQWWRCLNYSDEYLKCCEIKGKSHELAETYALFGDVTMAWPVWWQKIGRKIFSERRQYPKVRAITEEDALRRLDTDLKDFLILDIPLNLTRVTILEQINKLFDEHHPGNELKIRAQSTAIVQLEDTKLQHKTIPTLVRVAEILHSNPDIQLYQLAQRAKLAEHHLGRSKSESLSVDEEKQRRQMAASRHKEQAQRLVHNAARLKFPSIN